MVLEGVPGVEGGGFFVGVGGRGWCDVVVLDWWWVGCGRLDDLGGWWVVGRARARAGGEGCCEGYLKLGVWVTVVFEV